MKAVLSFVLFALFQLASAGTRPATGSGSNTGVILSTYFYCEIPCQEKMGMYLGTTDGVSPTRRIQSYLPSTVVEERQFDTFSAWDPATKTFTTVAAEYPRQSTLTLWTSTVSGTSLDTMEATPVISALEVAYPISSSPAPLNNIKLVLAKVIQGPNGGLLAIFTNGEVHALDVKTGTFSLLHKLIADSRALEVDFPSTSSAHVFDFDRNGMWSVVSAGINAYVVFTDFTTKTVGDWVQMNANMLLDPGKDAVETDFSPEFFINAMMVEAADNKGKRLLLQLESLNDVGFDMLTFVNTTTGVFEGPEYNLFPEGIVFECQSFNCDMKRVSAFDPVSKTIWFQGHVSTGDNEGNICINQLTFETTPVAGIASWYVATPNIDADFGFTNFQFYNF